MPTALVTGEGIFVDAHFLPCSVRGDTPAEDFIDAVVGKTPPEGFVRTAAAVNGERKGN